MAVPAVLDLDDVIRRYAWEVLKKRSNFLRRWTLDEKDYYCSVDWRAITFQHNVSKFNVRPEERTFNTDWGTIRTGTRWVELHACDFENRSESKQSHTFRGSRQTTTWLSVVLSQGYTVDKGADVEITIPSQFRHLRAGRDTGIKVTKFKGNVFKEVVEWEVNSQVEVMPSWRAHCALMARQQNHVIDFEVRTTLSVPNGIVPVYFKRHSDNGTAFEIKLDKFEEIFGTPKDGGVLREEELPLVHTLMETVINQNGAGHSSSKLQLLTCGTCVSVSWSDQKVDIKTSALSFSDGDDGDVQQLPKDQCLEQGVE